MDEGDFDCSICNDTGRVYNDDTEVYELCECRIRERLKHYLSRIGNITNISDELKESVTGVLDDPFNDYHIRLKNGMDTGRFNAFIAHCLRAVFPKQYALRNIYRLHTELRTDGNFSDVLNYNEPLFVMTAGLEEEYEGYTKEGEKWTTKAYCKTANQVVSNRRRFGLPTWVIERGSEYQSLKNHCMEIDFESLDKSNNSSDNSNKKSI